MTKSPEIVALMIGRGGSSLPGKNVLPVHGTPLLLWAAAAAVRSRHIGRYYISSDDTDILSTAVRAGYRPILRPPELCTATAQSTDAVRHALRAIQVDGPVQVVVVQPPTSARLPTALLMIALVNYWPIRDYLRWFPVMKRRNTTRSAQRVLRQTAPCAPLLKQRGPCRPIVRICRPACSLIIRSGRCARQP